MRQIVGTVFKIGKQWCYSKHLQAQEYESTNKTHPTQCQITGKLTRLHIDQTAYNTVGYFRILSSLCLSIANQAKHQRWQWHRCHCQCPSSINATLPPQHSLAGNVANMLATCRPDTRCCSNFGLKQLQDCKIEYRWVRVSDTKLIEMSAPVCVGL